MKMNYWSRVAKSLTCSYNSQYIWLIFSCFYTDTEPRTELYFVGEPGGVLAGEAARRGRHAVRHHSAEDYTGRGPLQNDASQPLQYHSEFYFFSHSFGDTYSIRLSMVSRMDHYPQENFEFRLKLPVYQYTEDVSRICKSMAKKHY